MPVDVTEDTIRVRVRDPGLFVDGSFRTITLSEDQGIKAVIGKLKSDPDGPTVIQTYIFDKSKWSASDAEQWVKDHKRSNKDNIERRCLTGEMRLSFDGKSPKITGYAAVFDEITELYPGYREKIAAGAFTETIQKDDVRALWNHNADYLLGRTKSKTLRLWEDDRGLGYEIIPPGTTWASDLMTLIKRGDLSQSSFGFEILKRSVEVNREKDEMLRTIEKVRLFDVSPVTFPAYSSTEVHVRMTTNDQSRIYFVGDEVIEVPLIQTPEESAPSDEELFRRYEELKTKLP